MLWHIKPERNRGRAWQPSLLVAQTCRPHKMARQTKPRAVDNGKASILLEYATPCKRQKQKIYPATAHRVSVGKRKKTQSVKETKTKWAKELV